MVYDGMILLFCQKLIEGGGQTFCCLNELGKYNGKYLLSINLIDFYKNNRGHATLNSHLFKFRISSDLSVVKLFAYVAKFDDLYILKTIIILICKYIFCQLLMLSTNSSKAKGMRFASKFCFKNNWSLIATRWQSEKSTSALKNGDLSTLAINSLKKTRKKKLSKILKKQSVIAICKRRARG